MWKPLIRCSIVGGIIIFLWMSISWMVLPMHKASMKEFAEPKEVSSVIMRYAPRDGIYVIPSWEETEKKPTNEPFIFVNIVRGIDYSSMTRSIIIGLITQIIGAFLITYLLLQAKAMKYWNRVWFVTIAGIAVAVLCAVPAWNWWHFPAGWTVLEIFDLAIGWFLGGLVIAKLVKN